MGGGGGPKKGKSTAPYIIGSSTSGVLEILIFHPIDTIAKRLMSNETVLFGQGRSTSESMGLLGKVIFKDASNRSFVGKWLSLFPGVSFGAVYKVLQRTYKFSAQPILRREMHARFGSNFDRAFGKNGHDMCHATAGALVGVGEVVLLPLDVLKIKAQTNPDALKGRNVMEMIAKENFKLYKGVSWTIARNCPGSFALFGTNSLVYTRMFGIKGPKEAAWWQVFLASMAGGISSIAVSSPLDVIKVRVQNRDFSDNRSGFGAVRDLLREEGPHAFFKGLTPKLALIGPKLVFSFTVAQWLIANIQRRWGE